MIFEQKYLTLSEIEIEHIDALNLLLGNTIPSFDWLKSMETVLTELRSYYYLFFTHTGNTPVGFFSLQVKIPPSPQTFIEKFKKKVSSKKEIIKIECFLKGVSGNYFFCQPQYENDIQSKINLLIKNHIDEFDKNKYETQLTVISNKKINMAEIKSYTIPKMMLKIHTHKKEFKNSKFKTFSSNWTQNECAINIAELIPNGFLKIVMIKNQKAKSAFCQISTNVDLNETHFYNIYLNTLDFLYENQDLSKIYFINFHNSTAPHFENLKNDFLEQLSITPETVYSYSSI